ncbi:MAG: hypothetical protein ACAH89_07155 [Rariglobus sp.]|nr:hypothetical protein [Rariglobus sp.]
MLAKFSIDYVLFPQHNKRVSNHPTDDPVEAEEVLMHLLLSQAQIKAIRHDGVALTRHQFDRMLKIAAERIVSELLSESLHIDAEEVKDRFGFAA